MAKVIWSHAAERDLVAIREYIAEDNPRAAQRVATRIRETVRKLREHPQLGRPTAEPPVRKLTVHGFPYVAYYLYHEATSTVFVVRVMHDAQQVGRPE